MSTIEHSVQEARQAQYQQFHATTTERFEIICDVAHPDTQQIPASFLSALADIEAGRLVDLDTALNQVPRA
jgi:hypothetical protein